MSKFEVWKLPKQGCKSVKQGSMFAMCHGRCGGTYRECLTARRIPWNKNQKEMRILEAKSYKRLFAFGNEERIRVNLNGTFNNLRFN